MLMEYMQLLQLLSSVSGIYTIKWYVIILNVSNKGMEITNCKYVSK